jgi:hypothetical protein
MLCIWPDRLYKLNTRSLFSFGVILTCVLDSANDYLFYLLGELFGNILVLAILFTMLQILCCNLFNGKLCACCGHTRMDLVRNDDIRDCLGVAPIEEKLVQHRLRWFGHVQRIPLEAPVHCGVLSQANNVRRGRGRPKLTWGEAIKRDLKAWDIPRDLCFNRSAWKAAIDVPEL